MALVAIVLGFAPAMRSQDSGKGKLLQQVRDLTDALTRTESQLEQSQRQLEEIRKQMAALQRELGSTEGDATAVPSPSTSPGAQGAGPDDLTAIRERQAIEESEITTHEQTKVESASKYPVKVTGMLLFSGFVNTGAVDTAATPTLALPGSGGAGATMRQTVLGFDAYGPRLFGARSYGDLRVDFNGNGTQANLASSYSGYYSTSAALLRLRTAHAGLQWERTDAYFSLDQPIVSPDTPTSLTAVAQPAMAWSGNLWTWNPQLGVKRQFEKGGAAGWRLEAALVDVGDAPVGPQVSSSPGLPSSAEQRRWPGVEAHAAWLGSGRDEERNRVGLGGYFAPHRSLGFNFDSWAGTMDAHVLLPARLELTASGYRGAALGGLGGGGYKDFAYYSDPSTGEYYLQPLDDAGGWAQLKERYSERFEMNAALGMDNVFAGELRQFAAPSGTIYQNLARNRTATGNFIYSPSAYLLFSIEYRRLESYPVFANPARSDVIGVGAGYKF